MTFSTFGLRLEIFNPKREKTGIRGLLSNSFAAIEVTSDYVAADNPGNILKNLVLADAPSFKRTGNRQLSVVVGSWFWK